MSFLTNLSKNIILIIAPLKESLADEQKFLSLLYDLGWECDVVPTDDLDALNIKIEEIFNIVKEIDFESNDEDFLYLFKSIKELYDLLLASINDIGNSIFGSGSSSVIFKDEFPKRLIEYLIVNYLLKHEKRLLTALELFQIIEEIEYEASTDRPYFITKSINWANFGELIKNPTNLIKENFNWNSIDFLGQRLFELLFNFLSARHIPAVYSNSTNENYAFSNILEIRDCLDIKLISIEVDEDYKDVGLKVLNVTSENFLDSGIIIALDFPSEITLNEEIGGDFNFSMDLSSLIGDSLSLLITPNKLDLKLIGNPTTELPPLGLGLRLEYQPDEAKMIFGKSDGTKLELKNAAIGLKAKYVGEELELIFEGDLSGLVFTLDPGDSDGFIGKVFGKNKKQINLPLAIQWSSKHGITFKGVGAFEISINPNIQFGEENSKVKINILNLGIALRAPANSDTLTAEVAASVSGKLGIISFVVEEIGLAFNIKTTEGNLGPIGIGLGFKPPKGIGLSIDAGKLKGGGYLFIDAEKGRYVGALELELLDKFSLTAIGIITTKAPDGGKGFSLLIMMNVTFTPAIALGFGFSLKGVGGLVAVNRRMSAEAIRLGVKSGAINRILFPEKIIENLPTIINDLEQIFPIQQDRYVFGLFAIIDWGASDAVKILRIKFGIVAEFPGPSRLAIIGTMSMKLPKEDSPVISLNVAFAGIIDFEKKYLTFDASIFDSKILTFSLSGDMAVRLFWGDQSEMLLSVGGFHPAYTPPSFLMLPAKMERITVILLDEGALKLKMMNYFAVTSNTAQFGARVEFLLEVSKFRVVGLLAFDVLFQFNPFKLLAQIEAMLAVYMGKRELISVSVKANIEGPGPWHAWGTGEFKVLGIKASANFNQTWGPNPKTTLPEIAVKPLIQTELSSISNWKTIIRENKKETVTIKNLEGQLILHPSGQLSITQKVAPLGVQLSKYASQKISDGGMYNISSVSIEGLTQMTVSEVDQFAPANYRDMKDDQKLKAASFEYLRCGVKIDPSTNSDLHFDTIIRKEVKYERIIIDKLHSLPEVVELDTILVNDFISGGTIGQNSVGGRIKREMDKPIISVSAKQEKYHIVSKDSLEELSYVGGVDSTVSNSLADVNTLLEKIIKTKPGLAGKIEAVPFI